MKEFDFDELDRAVNNLMGDAAITSTDDTTGDANTTPVPAAPTASTEPQADSSAAPAVEPAKPVAEEVAKPAAQPQVIPRQAGRFMDVMHPSADMTSAKSQPSRAPSRQGPTLTPVSNLSAADINKKTDQTNAEQPVVEQSAEPQPDLSTNQWPDPLETTQPEIPVAPAVEETPVASETQPAEEAPVESEDDAALASPFLADAKVEKRPLGGLSENTEAITAAEPVETEVKLDQGVISPSAPELDNELMAIESGEKSEENPTGGTEQSVVAEAAAPVADTKLTAPAAVETSMPTPNVPAGPVAIQPQYKESPSSGDANNGAIFDTDTYHKPLDHPAKKKSGWIWVLLILGLILIGAGIGAAYYTFLG